MTACASLYNKILLFVITLITEIPAFFHFT